MPIVKPGDPLLSGFQLNAPIVMPKLFGPVWGGAGQVPGWAATAWAAANYGQWSQITGHIVGHLGATVGVPEWYTKGFATFFEKLPLVPPGQVVSAALGSIAALVGKGLAECYTSVPILGWIVQLGIGIFDLVQSAIQVNKKKPRPAGEAIAFDGDDNDAEANALLGAAKEADWTLLFAPPSRNGNWSARHVSWTPGGAGEGWAMGVPGELGAGLVPGIAECVGTLTTQDGYTNYQWPNRSQGLAFGAEFDIPPLSTAGALTPSSRQIAVLLWQMLMKPSETMFRIDPVELESYWNDYYLSLRDFADGLASNAKVKSERVGDAWQRGLNPKLAFNEATIASSYLAYTGTSSGEVKLLGPETVDNFDTSAPLQHGVPQGVSLDELATAGALSYTYADVTRYILRMHHRRALAALKTVTVAYVPESAPLLRAGGSDWQLWRDMRALLLSHRAVMQVELDLVPDQEYRSAVAQAQRTRGIVADVPLAGMPPSSKADAGDGPPTVDGKPLPPLPPSPGPGLPPGTPPPRSDPGAAILAALVGTAVAYGAVRGAVRLSRRRPRR